MARIGRAFPARPIVGRAAAAAVAGRAASLNVTEVGDSLVADDYDGNNANAIIAEAPDALVAAAAHPDIASAVIAEAHDSASATASNGTPAAAVIAESPDSASSAATHPDLATALLAEVPDALSATASHQGAALDVTEAGDTLAAIAESPVEGTGGMAHVVRYVRAERKRLDALARAEAEERRKREAEAAELPFVAFDVIAVRPVVTDGVAAPAAAEVPSRATLAGLLARPQVIETDVELADFRELMQVIAELEEPA